MQDAVSKPGCRHENLDRFQSRGYAFQEEALYRCRKIGCRFEETPILFEDRRHGESKISFKESREALRVMLPLAWDRLLGRPVTRTKGCLTVCHSEHDINARTRFRFVGCRTETAFHVSRGAKQDLRRVTPP
jgi:hypothetical protein